MTCDRDFTFSVGFEFVTLGCRGELITADSIFGFSYLYCLLDFATLPLTDSHNKSVDYGSRNYLSEDLVQRLSTITATTELLHRNIAITLKLLKFNTNLV